MQNPFPHIIHNNTFWVSSERCLWWEEENTLIVSDIHIGKTGHFRKAGIGVPQNVYKADLQRLLGQLFFFKANRLIVVGDLTHSKANNELELFIKWRQDFSSLRIDLVKGNHDILEDNWYKQADIHVAPHNLVVDDFCFRHDLKTGQGEFIPEEVAYTFVGHVHPGVTVKGKGKQSLHFPCFYFTADHCILPAFSRFTGTYTVQRKKNETIYAIADNQLINIL